MSLKLVTAIADHLIDPPRIQPPHVPHMVLSLLPTVCQGGHFISIVTLRGTLLGAFHTFFKGNTITNADKLSFPTRLHSIAALIHKAVVQDSITTEGTPRSYRRDKF